MNKPGFYFFKLHSNNKYIDYGSMVALLHPSGKVEKLYVGNNVLMSNFVLSSDWYKAENPNLSGWEYLGL